MERRQRRSSHRWLLLVTLAFGWAALPPGSGAQTVDGVSVMPSPVCVDRTATVQVTGTGTCNQLRVCYDFDTSSATCNGGGNCTANPNLDCIMNANFSSPQVRQHVYDTAGSYTIRAGSPDCTGEALVDVDVTSCITAGQAPDGDLVPVEERPRAGLDEERAIVDLRPVISSGPFGGIVQPGNAAPFVVFGERLPLPGEAGRAFLLGNWGGDGVDRLEISIVAANADGSGVALQIADNVSGVPDQTVALVIQNAEGWESNSWLLTFVAAREVRLLPQSDVELVECSTSSDTDCCSPDFYDSDVVSYFCPTDDDASFHGSHQTAWGMPRTDVGIDRFRIRLAPGWEIFGIALDVDQEEGESRAWRTSPSAGNGMSDFEEVVNWWTTPNDLVFYRGYVYAVGPRGTPHR